MTAINDEVMLSIIVPVYNHGKYIAEALDSIIMQKTGYSYEVLVGDDCSTDSSRDILREYEKKAIEFLLESSKFGLTWDIGHSKAIGEKDVPFIMSHQDHLIHFHIHDGSENPPRNHLALGDGEIDIKDRLNLAKESRCVLETKTIEALKKSVIWLKMWYY